MIELSTPNLILAYLKHNEDMSEKCMSLNKPQEGSTNIPCPGSKETYRGLQERIHKVFNTRSINF